jgi:predicted metal-dependent HD superfamily phosphohydrolase
MAETVVDRSQLESRWRDLCRSAGFTAGDVDEAGRWLLDAYGVSTRAYHNLAHLAQCLAEFDAVRPHAADPVTAEMAIWFHDSVYDPNRSDNEARSAEWARSVLGFLGAMPGLVAAVQVIVLATRHAEPVPPFDSPDAPMVADAALVADADLAILGQPSDAFDAYERAIREEYRHVPDEGFRVARLGILTRLLGRPRIYSTLPFRARYETAARENLARSIGRLSAPASPSPDARSSPQLA